MDHIDFVVTWVNETDAEWLARRQTALDRAKPRSVATASEGVRRYRDLGLLRYWFRSVESNAPWVRKIHFVTESRLPEWLRIDHPKIQIIDGDRINPSDIATYNSHSVEACLPYIPDLSERFVYFNDDFFIANPVPPEFYFRGHHPYGFPLPTFLARGDVHSHAMLNACRIINTNFTRAEYLRAVLPRLRSILHQVDILRAPLYFGSLSIPPVTDIHLPTPLTKTVMHQAFASDVRMLSETRRSQFRSTEDVAPIYLAMMWHVASGKFFAVSKRQTGSYLSLRDHAVKDIISTIESMKVPQFCINDGDTEDVEEVKKMIVSALDTRWPARSSFEKW